MVTISAIIHIDTLFPRHDASIGGATSSRQSPIGFVIHVTHVGVVSKNLEEPLVPPVWSPGVLEDPVVQSLAVFHQRIVTHQSDGVVNVAILTATVDIGGKYVYFHYSDSDFFQFRFRFLYCLVSSSNGNRFRF